MEILNTSFLKPIIEGSDKLGINIQKILQHSDLKYFNYNNDDAYVPMHSANQFLSLLCENQGIDDITSVFSDFIHISALKDFSSLLDSSLTLLDACLIAEQMSNCILSNEVLKLKIIGNKVIFSQCFSNLSTKEYERVIQINFAYLLNGFKAIAPKNWAPTEIFYQSNNLPVGFEKMLSSSKTKVLINQPVSAVIFETEELVAIPPSLNTQYLDKNNHVFANQNSLLFKIEALFNSYQVDSTTPSISNISNMLGVSERTLRRKLKEENLTFNAMFSSWRIRTAIRLLKNDNLSIEDVSQHLFYANAKNFSRAFKHTFHVSPSQYKETINS